jgi:cobalt-zinc-cadmium resistance protein CzcA
MVFITNYVIMLNRIIAFSIRNKLLIGLLIIALIAYGSLQFTKLPIDAVPDITDNQVQVITVTPSLGAPEVERLITFPIEQANSNIPGLKEIRSFSRFGLSLITIVFEDDIDVYWARQQVTERLKIAETQIPKGVGSPELAPVTSGLGEIYQYVVKPKPGYQDQYSPVELRTIQDWIIRRQLIGVKGVADVSSFGGRVKQFEIAVDVHKLNALGITIQDIFSALEKNNENTGGGYIEKSATVLYIRVEGLIGDLADISNIVIKNIENGNPLLVRDVAEVRIGHATRYGAITYNDEGEVAGGIVMMLKGENSSRVIEGVKERIRQIKKTLPEGVMIEPFLDRTKMVNSAISTVSKNLLEGALIVIFILVLFLGNFKAGILVASVIPLSLLFAVIMMNLFGVSGNLMSLGALDFGLIVDGAVIIVEAVMHGLFHKKRLPGISGLSQEEMDEEVRQSAGRMVNSAVFGQIIILIVYLPIFTLEGIEGKMFKPMAQTVAFTLMGAFILSLTYVPMMSALFLSKKVTLRENFSDKMMRLFVGIQQETLKKAMNYQKTILAGALLLFLFSVFVLTRLGGEFIPDLPEGDFAVDTRVLTGSNLNTSTEACLASAHILLTGFPEVEKVVSKTGSGEIPTDPMPMEASDMMVILKDKKEWTSAKSWDELAIKMSNALSDLPGVTYSFQYPVAMRFNELMTGAKQDVVCKIFGDNLDSLSKYAGLIGSVVKKIEGARDVYVEPINGLPQLVIRYERAAIARYGLNIQDINKTINTAFAGQSSGLIYEDEKRFDLVVRLAGEQRQNPEDMGQLLIPTPQGIQIPLNQVAKISIEERLNQIQREDAKRRIMVGFNVQGKDVQTIVQDLQNQMDQQIQLPIGYYVTFGGSFENLIAAKQRLFLAVPISLILIFLFLFFAFGSLKQGFLIYSAIPLSAIGGILFLALRDMSFSISAGVGFIALFGVAVLNGIVLISAFNRIRREGQDDLREVVLQGTKLRLRPVLMTAFVASLGLLPMAISPGAGAEVQRPLATVVIGGLLMSTFLTLIILPILYLLFEKSKPMKRKAIIPASIILCVIFGTQTRAQDTLDLQSAIELALKNNLGVKAEILRGDYLKKKIDTYLEIPPTEIQGEFGQINSIYPDTRFTISQSVPFPAVYKRQKALNQEYYREQTFQVATKENEVKKQVRELFFQQAYLMEKEKILIRSDSIYMSFLEKAIFRFAKGESNILEKIFAETALSNIRIQLKDLRSDMGMEKLKWQVLLHQDIEVVPDYGSLNLPIDGDIHLQRVLEINPGIKILEQQKKIAEATTRVVMAEKLPNLNIAFSNGSIRGVGADEKFYDSSDRFNAIQLGLQVPLFLGAQKAKVHSAETLELISENNLVYGRQQLSHDFKMKFQAFEKSRERIQYYEATALPNATLLKNTADIQYAKGEINYLVWAGLIQQALSVESEYLDAVHGMNRVVTDLYFLTGK